jgi:hypothetical protein
MFGTPMQITAVNPLYQGWLGFVGIYLLKGLSMGGAVAPHITTKTLIHMSGSPDALVADILSSLGSEKIWQLMIIDHGSLHDLNFGAAVIDLNNVELLERSFSRLKGRFSNDGFTFLMQCYAGQHTEIMSRIAKATGARVVGGTDIDHNFYNEGQYVWAFPDGHLAMQSYRPFATPII